MDGLTIAMVLSVAPLVLVAVSFVALLTGSTAEDRRRARELALEQAESERKSARWKQIEIERQQAAALEVARRAEDARRAASAADLAFGAQVAADAERVIAEIKAGRRASLKPWRPDL